MDIRTDCARVPRVGAGRMITDESLRMVRCWNEDPENGESRERPPTKRQKAVIMSD